MVEDAESVIEEREQEVGRLRCQIDGFEQELGELQEALQKITGLNQEIAKECEQWQQEH